MKKVHAQAWLTSYRLPFSWSYSRAQAFELCRRAYYYRYYAPYGGNSPKELGDRAGWYGLSKLTTIPAMLGKIIHTVARDSLIACQAKCPWDTGTTTATARLLLAKAWKISLHASEHKERPGRQPVLLAHYLSCDIVQKPVMARLEQLTAALLAHPVYRNIANNAHNILQLDQVRRYQLDDVPVFSVPDVLMQEPDGTYHLLDWKTGRVTSEYFGRMKTQLGVYALDLVRNYQVNANQVLCEVVDIPSGCSYAFRMTAQALAETETAIRQSIAEMRACQMNIELNQAVIEDHPMVNEDKTGGAVCATCVYRTVCFGTAPEVYS